MLQQLNKQIVTIPRGRYTDVFICYDEMDTFGKIIPRKIFFDSVLPYKLALTLKQAKNINSIGG